jgi:hypothetical protein
MRVDSSLVRAVRSQKAGRDTWKYRAVGPPALPTGGKTADAFSGAGWLRCGRNGRSMRRFPG